MCGIVADSEPLPSGQRLYELHCAACHGENGDGQGPAAVWLYPKPRNFSAGLFKIHSTPAGTLPSDEDLFQVITRGMPGSSMPAFNYLSEAERRQLVAYVKYLTAYRDESGRRVNRFEQAAAEGALGQPVEVPPEPPADMASLTLGKAMYEKMQCFTCHGPTGAGDGPQVPTLKDAFGLPARPRDFNTSSFRGGPSGRDLYLRIHNGLAGTPMVPYGDDVMTPNERWALVHYVQSLRRTEVAVNDLLTPEHNLIRAFKVRRLPGDPLDPAWERFDPVRVPLQPLWPEPDPVYAVAVTALHDGRRLALLCQWRDELPQRMPIRVQDFEDAVALQFSMTTNYPFLGMGDAANPVNLWQWKAGWQAQVEAGGSPVEMRLAYPNLYVSTYLASTGSTAAEAGNLLALPPRSAVEDANARGFGSFKSQPPDGQNVWGKGLWQGGAWRVVFVRTLKSRDQGDVKFAPGRPVPVSFAVWNGGQGDRNGRKAISNWYQLVLE